MSSQAISKNQEIKYDNTLKRASKQKNGSISEKRIE